MLDCIIKNKIKSLFLINLISSVVISLVFFNYFQYFYGPNHNFIEIIFIFEHGILFVSDFINYFNGGGLINPYDISPFIVFIIIFRFLKAFILTFFNIFIFEQTKNKKILFAILLIPYLIQISSMVFVYLTPEYKNSQNKEYLESKRKEIQRKADEDSANYIFKRIESDGCNDGHYKTETEVRQCERILIKKYLDIKYRINNNATDKLSDENIFNDFFDQCIQIKDAARKKECFEGLFLAKKFNEYKDEIPEQYGMPSESDSPFIKKLLGSKENYCSFAYKNVKEEVTACVKRLP